jgi:hypothetical protein
MVEVEAGPKEVATEHCPFGHVVLEAPAAVWLVILDALKEEWIKGSAWQIKLLLLLRN